MIRREEVIGDCRLILGDCLEVLPTLGPVDAVVTDPPYGIGIASWDHALLLDWFGEALSHLGGCGAAYVFGDSLTLSRFQTYWEDRGVNWSARIVWTYEDGPRNSKAWTSKHEDCLFYAGPDHKLVTPKEPSIHKDPRWGDDRLVGDVWKCPRVLGNYSERSGHKTQKPLALMELPIRASTKDGQTILDPFMGSGTTGVACVNLGRKFIGIEIDETYFDIACRRIEEAYRQPRLFDEEPKPKPIQRSLLGGDAA